jgi:hypothetical protein
MAPRWWSVSEEGRRHLGGGRAMAPVVVWWSLGDGTCGMVVANIVRKGNGIPCDDCVSEEGNWTAEL